MMYLILHKFWSVLTCDILDFNQCAISIYDNNLFKCEDEQITQNSLNSSNCCGLFYSKQWKSLRASPHEVKFVLPCVLLKTITIH